GQAARQRRISGVADHPGGRAVLRLVRFRPPRAPERGELSRRGQGAGDGGGVQRLPVPALRAGGGAAGGARREVAQREGAALLEVLPVHLAPAGANRFGLRRVRAGEGEILAAERVPLRAPGAARGRRFEGVREAGRPRRRRDAEAGLCREVRRPGGEEPPRGARRGGGGYAFAV